jgi:hypothetical protein
VKVSAVAKSEAPRSFQDSGKCDQALIWSERERNETEFSCDRRKNSDVSIYASNAHVQNLKAVWAIVPSTNAALARIDAIKMRSNTTITILVHSS